VVTAIRYHISEIAIIKPTTKDKITMADQTYHEIVRARNDFYYKLRNTQQTQEQFTKLFEELFNINPVDFDNTKVFSGTEEQWNELKRSLYPKQN
jgi:hypothetical protein